jgi:ABC-type multidrug transport system ATPase subunit
MIDARGLTKRYGEKLAVDDLTFKVVRETRSVRWLR